MHDAFRFAAAVVAAMAQSALAAEPAFFPPDTPAKPVAETIFGVTLTDRYRWQDLSAGPKAY